MAIRRSLKHLRKFIRPNSPVGGEGAVDRGGRDHICFLYQSPVPLLQHNTATSTRSPQAKDRQPPRLKTATNHQGPRPPPTIKAKDRHHCQQKGLGTFRKDSKVWPTAPLQFVVIVHPSVSSKSRLNRSEGIRLKANNLLPREPS